MQALELSTNGLGLRCKGFQAQGAAILLAKSPARHQPAEAIE